MKETVRNVSDLEHSLVVSMVWLAKRGELGKRHEFVEKPDS